MMISRDSVTNEALFYDLYITMNVQRMDPNMDPMGMNGTTSVV